MRLSSRLVVLRHMYNYVLCAFFLHSYKTPVVSNDSTVMQLCFVVFFHVMVYFDDHFILLVQ